MKPPRTHCKRGHEMTEENTYHSRQGKRVCRTCRDIVHEQYRREHPPKSRGVTGVGAEPNTIKVDGVALNVRVEIPYEFGSEQIPSHRVLLAGDDIGEVYQLNDRPETTWFARHTGDSPTGPYPDLVAALRGLMAS